MMAIFLQVNRRTSHFEVLEERYATTNNADLYARDGVFGLTWVWT
jgi:hypothetical protein